MKEWQRMVWRRAVSLMGGCVSDLGSGSVGIWEWQRGIWQRGVLRREWRSQRMEWQRIKGVEA